MTATRRDPLFGCDLVAHVDAQGYGRVGRRQAHIVAWEAEFGAVPEGFELDHACRRRNCRALAHLEAVTRSENELRKSPRYRARMQRCKAGHDMRLNAMVTPEGGRVCRECSLPRKGQAA